MRLTVEFQCLSRLFHALDGQSICLVLPVEIAILDAQCQSSKSVRELVNRLLPFRA